MKSCKYKSADELPMILNANEAADFIGVGKSQIYELIRRIDFPAFKIGQRIFIHRDKFLAWIDAQIEEKESVFYTDPRIQ